MTIATLLGSVGSIFAFCLQLSPFPAMIEGLKTNDIPSMTISYFVMGIFGSVLWTCFGFGINDIFVYGVNIVGITLFGIYLNIFIYVKCDMKTFLMGNLGLLLEFIIAYIYFSPSLCLYLAVIVACIWQSSTIETMRYALEQKDAKFVNILLAVVSLLNFADWFIYGVLIQTYMMSFQNFVCGFFCAMNIYIYMWCNGYMSHDNVIIELMKKAMMVKEIQVSKNTNEIDVKTIPENQYI